MECFKISGQKFYNMVVNASNNLEEEKGYVNSLNVFPVPDGDTGTNMSMTLRAAVSEIEGMDKSSLGEVAKKLAKGALMGARGNSGVILSQILRGIAKGFENKDEATATDFQNALLEGSKSAYKAVMRPTEGTILTIIRAAGEAASKSTEKDITSLLKEVCAFSEETLNKTPDMLPVLKKAKVVDSGGMGLLIILKGMYSALLNNIDAVLNEENKQGKTGTNAEGIENENIKFGYCTEFIILTAGADVNSFKNEIEKYGDSMIVVGVEDVIKVHIHTNDPGFILSKAVKLGELSKIKIDNMREEHRHLLVKKEDEEKSSQKKEEVVEEDETKKYGFVAVAMGEGIKNIFSDLGVDFVIEGGQTMNPSTQDILDCINNVNAENIFVLPNNKNIIMAATQAAEIGGKNIIVVPTKSIPQGISAVTVFNQESSIEDNMKEMQEAISAVKTGSVTYAVRDTEAFGKEIKEGDIIGLNENKITAVGKDIINVSEELIHSMADEEAELITIYYGEGINEDNVMDMVNKLEEEYKNADIQCYEGKQPLYYFIISVE